MCNIIWKIIDGFDGYEVSNDGQVKSRDRVLERKGNRGWSHVRGKLLKPMKDWKGYLFVELSGKSIKIHRLVALAFIPNPEKKPQINHKDGDKTNNNFWNLEWATNSENQIHAYKIGLQKARNGSKSNWSKLTESQALEIRNEVNKKIVELSEKYGVSTSTISDIRNKKTWKHI